MKLDSAFQIGKTHDICEDYALTGVIESPAGDAFYTVVSDGCSSSKNVDLGARILSHSAVEEIKNIYRNSAHLMFSFNQDSCITRARSSIEALKAQQDSLDATLLMSYSTSNCTEIVVCGDGCVAIGFEDKRILVINFDFPSGFPFYPNYLPNYSTRFAQWYQIQKDEYPCKITASIINEDGTFEELYNNDSPIFTFSANKKSVMISARDKNYGGNVYFFDEEKETLPKFIVSMSDGIGSFYKTEDAGTSLTNSNIDYREVINEVLNFKNFNGKFMQRRLNRFLKFCAKNNWHHADDISFGAMYFGDK